MTVIEAGDGSAIGSMANHGVKMATEIVSSLFLCRDSARRHKEAGAAAAIFSAAAPDLGGTGQEAAAQPVAAKSGGIEVGDGGRLRARMKPL